VQFRNNTAVEICRHIQSSSTGKWKNYEFVTNMKLVIDLHLLIYTNGQVCNIHITLHDLGLKNDF